MSFETPNAIAGPSNTRTPPPPATPHLFLPPPAPPQSHHTYLSSTQDLLARFDLLSAYDKYVRPFAAPTETGLDQMASAPTTTKTSINGGLDKGKGKEVVDTPDTPGFPDGADGDDEEGGGGKGDKKKKNNYKHLIKGIPGKHSFRKDDYLWTMMQIPPKQRMPIQPFDIKSQREAFTVSLEGLKGWNPSALVLESPQAREDRKKRKELKRLQKSQSQAQTHAALATSVPRPPPIQAPLPTPATTSSLTRAPPISAGTPRLEPSSTGSGPISKLSGTTTHRPGSTIPRPGFTVPKPTKPGVAPTGMVATPLRVPGIITSTIPSTNSYTADLEKRGTKRERDEIGGPVSVNGTGAKTLNGTVAPNPTTSILNAKAGIAGVRPRPIKKQRMDIQGQARDMTMTQQPTPQGV